MNRFEFGNEIRRIREDLCNLNRREFGEKYSWHFNTIKGYEKDGRVCDIDYLVALSYEAGYPLMQLLEMRINVGISEDYAGKLNKDRFEAAAAAIRQISAINDQKQYAIEECSSEFSIFEGESLKIEDDLMHPTIKENATVMYDRTDNQLKSGQLYVVNLGGQKMVRRVQLALNGEIVLYCENKSGRELVVQNESKSALKVEGRVLNIVNPG